MLAINGHATAELLPRLRSLIAADGYGTQFQDKELEAGFFDEYYWNFYPARTTFTRCWWPAATANPAAPAGLGGRPTHR